MKLPKSVGFFLQLILLMKESLGKRINIKPKYFNNDMPPC